MTCAPSMFAHRTADRSNTALTRHTCSPWRRGASTPASDGVCTGQRAPPPPAGAYQARKLDKEDRVQPDLRQQLLVARAPHGPHPRKGGARGNGGHRVGCEAVTLPRAQPSGRESSSSVRCKCPSGARRACSRRRASRRVTRGVKTRSRSSVEVIRSSSEMNSVRAAANADAPSAASSALKPAGLAAIAGDGGADMAAAGGATARWRPARERGAEVWGATHLGSSGRQRTWARPRG